METHRLLVVDDDPGVRDVLCRGLAAEGYDVRAAGDGESGLIAVAEWAPHVVVLDLLLPVMSGIEMCRRLRRQGSTAAVLLLTAKDGVADQVLGLDAGADDYVVKPFSFPVLVAHIRALLRRTEASAAPLHYADLTLDVGAHVAHRGGREIPLTTTEFKLLLELLRRPEQVISKEDLTERVWRYDFAGNYNVVEVYIRHLRQKLEEAHRPRLIQTLRGAGYMLRETDP